MPEALVGKSVTLGILEAFVKKLDIIITGYNFNPYC